MKCPKCGSKNVDFTITKETASWYAWEKKCQDCKHIKVGTEA